MNQSPKRPFKQTVILWILFIVCRLLSMSWRIRVVGMDRRRRAVAMSPCKSFLISSFHENAASGVLSHVGQNICTMVSQSKDGEIVAFIGEKIGLKAVRGSSSRGGKAVRDAMVDMVMSGVIGAITVDGPRGPRRVLKNGVVDIASRTGVPVVPTVCMGDPMWILRKTWDQTRIPKPFARLLIHYGEPMIVPPRLREEEFKGYLSQITDAMNRDDDLVLLRFNELWDQSIKP